MNADGTINWVGQENFGNRGIHEMTVNGKALVKAYYGQAQDYAYFNGCSTGGRQGVMEAQKFPLDYDGIAAGAPVINYMEMQLAQLWSQLVMLQEDDVLSSCKLANVLDAVIASCDTNTDGVADGVIGDPLACNFDFKSLIGTVTSCDETITAQDVMVLEKIRQGPRGVDGKFLWYGLVPGAPYAGLTNSTVVDGELVGQPFSNPVQVIAYWIEQNPDWDWRTETYASFEQHIKQGTTLYDDVHSAKDPDLRPFVDNGGKLLLWHGWADFGVYTQGTIDYYEHVKDILGSENISDSVRLFLAPGVGHCSGGNGPQPTQQLESLVRWVEQGQAPEVLPAQRTQGGTVVATRPICAYPTTASYSGTGDVNDAANFTCIPAAQLTPGNDPKITGDGIQIEATIPEAPDGFLSMTIANYGDLLSLALAENTADKIRFTGTIPQVTITDSRNPGQAGANGGWMVSGQSSDFTSGSNNVGPGNLGWTPELLTDRPGLTAGGAVSTVLSGGTGLVAPATLASADSDGRFGTSNLSAGLVLELPVDTPAGTYRGALVVSLFPVD